jgi:hypothetical protein
MAQLGRGEYSRILLDVLFAPKATEKLRCPENSQVKQPPSKLLYHRTSVGHGRSSNFAGIVHHDPNMG